MFSDVVNHIFTDFIFTVLTKENVIPADIGGLQGGCRAETLLFKQQAEPEHLIAQDRAFHQQHAVTQPGNQGTALLQPIGW